MKRSPLGLGDVALVNHPRFEDERGSFERIACRTSLESAGLDGSMRQISLSSNVRTHTLRGLHFQRRPSQETKLVRVLRGRVFDVAVDLRPGSDTLGRWVAVELSPETATLYVPAGFAHGFLTLEPNTQVLYSMSADYDSALQAGVRWDDPQLAIDWPASPAVLSDRDTSHPQLRDLDLDH